jgi:hypothetical protein
VIDRTPDVRELRSLLSSVEVLVTVPYLGSTGDMGGDGAPRRRQQ